METLFAVALLIFALIELRKGLLILIKNQTHIIFAISMSTFVLRFLSSQKQQIEAWESYKKAIKVYGALNIMASVYMIFISIEMIFRNNL